MIYIIDDKKERQKMLSPNLVESNNVRLVYEYNGDLKENTKIVFEQAQVIAMHESFFKNPINKHPTKKEEEIRRSLKEYCFTNKIKLVFFSGDYLGYHEVIKNAEAVIGVARFYKNINDFIQEFIENGEYNIQILGFGRNYLLENTLSYYLKFVKEVQSNSLESKISLKKLINILGKDDSLDSIMSKNIHDLKNIIPIIDQYLILFYENIQD